MTKSYSFVTRLPKEVMGDQYEGGSQVKEFNTPKERIKEFKIQYK